MDAPIADGTIRDRIIANQENGMAIVKSVVACQNKMMDVMEQSLVREKNMVVELEKTMKTVVGLMSRLGNSVARKNKSLEEKVKALEENMVLFEREVAALRRVGWMSRLGHNVAEKDKSLEQKVQALEGKVVVLERQVAALRKEEDFPAFR
ncbi:MAG: hypothetical protein LQ350_007869 [Teloschistes chrysophthalmus]|nr:MAG: hypothetical protein LQ350_007869 [Niorma chrysophthalma]